MENKEYLKRMGERIKAVRNSKGVSLRRLGEACKIDYSAICRIEGGQYSCRILTLKAIADELGVNVKDFL